MFFDNSGRRVGWDPLVRGRRPVGLLVASPGGPLCIQNPGVLAGAAYALGPAYQSQAMLRAIRGHVGARIIPLPEG